jgi:secretory phospholipase A2
VGNIAGNDSEVGDHVGADRCCREHDRCPYTIEGFTTKYNLYNFRFHTISHCECDDVFRTCLLSANSDQANHIGNLFFNVLGLKCFAFRRDMVCAERSWWGRCQRERPQISAETRDPLVYLTAN